MIIYLLIYLIGCILSYFICKIARHKSEEESNEDIDKEITSILVATSWLSVVFFLFVFFIIIKDKFKNEKI